MVGSSEPFGFGTLILRERVGDIEIKRRFHSVSHQDALSCVALAVLVTDPQARRVPPVRRRRPTLATPTHRPSTPA
jgi:hypothetical protein